MAASDSHRQREEGIGSRANSQQPAKASSRQPAAASSHPPASQQSVTVATAAATSKSNCSKGHFQQMGASANSSSHRHCKQATTAVCNCKRALASNAQQHAARENWQTAAIRSEALRATVQRTANSRLQQPNWSDNYCTQKTAA